MVNQTKEDTVSMVEQSKTYKLFLAICLLFFGGGTIWVITKVPIPEIAWFNGMLGGLLTINFSSQLIMLYFFSPQSIIIHNDVFTFNFLFRRNIVIRNTDIDRIKNSAFLSLILSHTGWLICSNRKHKYVMNKKFFNNYDALIDVIDKHNPKCLIDEEMGGGTIYKDEIQMAEMDSISDLIVSETYQDNRKNVFLISAIIVGIAALVIAVNSLLFNFFGVASMALLSTLLLKEIVEACLRVFAIPRKISIRANSIIIQRYFRNENIVGINEIKNLKYGRALSLFVPGSGYLECKGTSIRIYVSKRLLHNFEGFISRLRQVTSHLIIDKRMM
jgi:hypothetical protein